MNKKTISLAVVCSLFLCSVAGMAQLENDALVDLATARDRKEPGFFKRAAKDTAEEQMAHADELRKRGSLKKAESAYRALVHSWHDSPVASQAQMNYAEILLERGKYRRSFDEFQYMVNSFAGQFDYDSVLDQQFKIANTLMTRKRGKFLFFPGFTSPERALSLFEQIVENAPEWSNTPQSQFNIGLIHEQGGDFLSAVEAYEVVRSRYSGSDYAAGGAFRRAHCFYELSKRSPRDEQLCRRAQMAVAGFLRNFTGDPNEVAAREYEEQLKNRLADLYYNIAVYYDKKVHKPAAAVIAYSDFIKQFPSSERAVEANRRRDELEAKLEGANDE